MSRPVLAVLFVFFLSACGKDSPPAETLPADDPGTPALSDTGSGSVSTPTSPGSETVATDSGPGASPPTRVFDIAFQPDSAWTYLARQVSFGPRVPGTPAHRACAEWLGAFLERVGGRVERDRWTHADAEGRRWPLENILARFGPEGGGRLLLLAHWDCRPWADEDPDPEKHDQPVLGANDAASGVAVLLEIARCLEEAPLPRGVDILLTDGEDLGEAGDPMSYCQGSQRFARKGLGAYRRAILLDMVGDADLRLPVEGYSLEYAPEVVDWVWGRARDLGSPVFTTEVGSAVFDDHVPLILAGLPAVDIIDFEYPPWHTTRDDLEAVSPRSLYEVGRVVLSLALRP